MGVVKKAFGAIGNVLGLTAPSTPTVQPTPLALPPALADVSRMGALRVGTLAKRGLRSTNKTGGQGAGGEPARGKNVLLGQ